MRSKKKIVLKHLEIGEVLVSLMQSKIDPDADVSQRFHIAPHIH